MAFNLKSKILSLGLVWPCGVNQVLLAQEKGRQPPSTVTLARKNGSSNASSQQSTVTSKNASNLALKKGEGGSPNVLLAASDPEKAAEFKGGSIPDSPAPSQQQNDSEIEKLDHDEQNNEAREATLGMLDKTQQEILLLQAQLELDKLKQQLKGLAPSPSFLSQATMVTDHSFSKSTSTHSEKIILLYKVGDKRYVRLQVNDRYLLDLSEGETLPSGEKILRIGSNDIVLENAKKEQRRLFIV